MLSIHPLIGNKANQIAKQKVKMAMAIRGSQNYYHLHKIQYRHFITQGKSVGFTEQEVVEVINDVINNVDDVIDTVSVLLPDNFPTNVSHKIFSGMKAQAKTLVL